MSSNQQPFVNKPTTSGSGSVSSARIAFERERGDLMSSVETRRLPSSAIPTTVRKCSLAFDPPRGATTTTATTTTSTTSATMTRVVLPVMPAAPATPTPTIVMAATIPTPPLAPPPRTSVSIPMAPADMVVVPIPTTRAAAPLAAASSTSAPPPPPLRPAAPFLGTPTTNKNKNRLATTTTTTHHHDDEPPIELPAERPSLPPMTSSSGPTRLEPRNADAPMYEAMHGDDPAAQALRQCLSNDRSGVSGIVVDERTRALVGTVVHQPRVEDLPELRPRIVDVTRVLGTETHVRVGVAEIVYQRYGNRLWLLGVLPTGQSVALELTGFEPSILVLPTDDVVATGTTPEQRRELVDRINHGVTPENERGETPTQAVVRCEEERRTPAIGFSAMRKDATLRFYLSSMRHADKVKEQLTDVLGFRVVHDPVSRDKTSWPVEQLFIHQTVRPPDRPGADVDYGTGIRLNRWSRVPRSAIQWTTYRPKTTAQMEGSVHWSNVVRDPTMNGTSLPLLSTSVDGEMISGQGYEFDLDVFPDATLPRDVNVCNAVVFYVANYGQSGPFLRCVFALGSHLPIPGCIVYTWNADQEGDMLMAMKRTLVDRCDVDNVGGYNSRNFDMPYWFKRARLLQLPKPWFEWHRFRGDACRLPQPGGGGGGRRQDQSISFQGRWQMDSCEIARDKWRSFKTHTLKVVCAEKLKSGINKVEMPYRQIAPNFHEGGPRGRSEVSFYCTVDALLVEALDRTQFLMSAYLEIASLTNTRFMDVMTKGQQIRVFNCIIEDVHHYGWYMNRFPMFQLGDDGSVDRDDYERPVYRWVFTPPRPGQRFDDPAFQCYHEPVPVDWDGYSPNDHIHRLLSEARDRGIIEPDLGYHAGDPRAAKRDDRWRRNLEEAWRAGHPQWGPPESWTTTQRAEYQLFLRAIMYDARRNTTKRKWEQEKRDSQDVKRQRGIQDFLVSAAASGRRPSSSSAAEDGAASATASSSPTSPPTSLPTVGVSAAGQWWTPPAEASPGLGTDPNHVRRTWPGDTPLGAEASAGGCVFRSIKGVLPYLFDILDFASLYPSIIQADDICYSTIVWDRRYMNVPGFVYRRGAYNGVFYFYAVPEPARLSSTEHDRAVAEKRPMPEPAAQTILPRILRRLVGARRQIKAQMKAAAKAGDTFRVSTLDSEQNAVKVICNGAYGFTNVNERMGYLPCPPLAYTICGTGRNQIRLCKYFSEHVLNGLVIYGDTDSIMVTFPELNGMAREHPLPPVPDTSALTKDAAKKVMAEYEAAVKDNAYYRAHKAKALTVVSMANSFFLTPHQLEPEKTCREGMFVIKKFYVYRNALSGELTTKGMASETRRYCDAVRTLHRQVQIDLLRYRVAPALRLIESFATRIGSNEIPLTELSMSARYNGTTKDKLLEKPYTFHKVQKRRGIQFRDGERIAYIMRAKRIGEKQYQQGEELQYAEEHDILPDAYLYFEQMRGACTYLLQFFVDTDVFFDRLYQVVHKLTSRRLSQMHGQQMFAVAAARHGGRGGPLVTTRPSDIDVSVGASGGGCDDDDGSGDDENVKSSSDDSDCDVE